MPSGRPCRFRRCPSARCSYDRCGRPNEWPSALRDRPSYKGKAHHRPRTGWRRAYLRRSSVPCENAAHRRLLVTGDIRVPIFSVDALGIGIGMDRQNLGMPFGPGRAGMNMQFTEISAEPLVGFHIQRLIAKEQNLALRQRLMQLLDLTVAEWLSQCDAVDIGADAGRNRRDGDGSIAHGMTFNGGGSQWRRTDRPHLLVARWPLPTLRRARH